MALKKCTQCGVFFGGEGDTCSKCNTPNGIKVIVTGDIEHDKFMNARAVVYEMPHISPDELVKRLNEMDVDITIKEVLAYVKAGRLSLVTEDGGTYCLSCGKRIMIGTMCADCTAKLEIFRASSKPVKKEEPKPIKTGMHTKK